MVNRIGLLSGTKVYLDNCFQSPWERKKVSDEMINIPAFGY